MSLPTFVIVGERRSGTTSLAKWLEPHPDVFLHPRLDMAYFVDDEIVGRLDWLDGELDYQRWDGEHSQVEYAAMFEAGESATAVGEKSADYLFWRPAHARLAKYLPECRFVVTLRNPIDRAWSHYWNEVGKGRETLSFEDALAAENDRITNSAYARDHLSYRTRGEYDESLRDLFQHVPREQVLVVALDDLMDRPVETAAEVFRWIGVDPELGMERIGTQVNENWTTLPSRWAELPGLKQLERGTARMISRTTRFLARDSYRARRLNTRLLSLFRKTKGDMRMSAETRADLQRHFAPHIARLEDLLARDFSHWKTDGRGSRSDKNAGGVESGAAA